MIHTLATLDLRKLGSVTLFVAVLLLSVGFASAADTFYITNLTQDPIAFSIQDLEGFENVEKTVTAVAASGRESVFTARGVLLADLLASQGFAQGDLEAIRLIAGDGYSIEVGAAILRNRDILLAHTIDGEPLNEESRPIRAIIPEERAMYWVRNLTSIEVTGAAVEFPKTTLRFLDTAAVTKELQEYPYHGEMDQAIAIADLLAQDGVGMGWERASFSASDGFSKNETVANVTSAFLKLTGAQAPVFLGPNLPGGMQIKDITYMALGEEAYVSVAQLASMIDAVTIGEVTGTPILEVFAYVNMIEAPVYAFAAADGYTVEVAIEDLAGGLLFFQDGQLRTYFDGLPRNTGVRDVYTVTALGLE